MNAETEVTDALSLKAFAATLRARAVDLRNRSVLHTRPRSAMRQELEGRAEECDNIASALDAAELVATVNAIGIKLLPPLGPPSEEDDHGT